MSAEGHHIDRADTAAAAPPGAPAGEERAVVVARLVAEIRSQPVGTAAAVEQAVVRFPHLAQQIIIAAVREHPGRCGEILQRLRRSSAIGARAVFTLLFMIAGSGLLSRRDAQAAEPGDGAKLSGGAIALRQGRDAGHRHSGLPGPGGRSRRASRGGGHPHAAGRPGDAAARGEGSRCRAGPRPRARAGLGRRRISRQPERRRTGVRSAKAGSASADALFLTAAPVWPCARGGGGNPRRLMALW